MRAEMTAVIVLLGTLVPAGVLAQTGAPGAETQLQQEMRHRRVIVRPLTPSDQVERDVERATTEIRQQEERDMAVRELSRPAQRAPQVDQDLKGGIQTRSLNNALRR
jgi:hypothetical protein